MSVYPPLEIFEGRYTGAIPIPPELPSRTTRFDLDVTLHINEYKFRFLWMGYKGYYILDAVRDDDKRLLNHRIRTGHPIVIRGFGLDPDIPDAVLAVIDRTLQNEQLLPSNLGKTHLLGLQLGRFRVAP